jgi:hypothetical protein
MIENVKKQFNFYFGISVSNENAPVKKKCADTMVKASIGFGLLLSIIDITFVD